MTTVKTDAALTARLKEAASVKLTASELDRQRVSFIMGMVGKKSGVTRERVREVIGQQEGRKVAG
jgi:invasion protein IalB